MTADTFQALLPWLVVAGGAVVTLLLTSAARLHGAVAGTAARHARARRARLSAGRAARPRPLLFRCFVVDGFTVYFAGLVLLGSIGVVWLAHGYFARHAEQREEFYTALLLATLGAITLVASRHLAALFLGLELLSVGLFVMAAYLRELQMSLEAGFKYLVLASVSSAFLVFAIALLYAACGTLEIPGIAAALGTLAPAETKLAIAGLALVLVAAGFKLALVPFHLWAPDVYEGSPTPSTAYLASVSKAAMLAIVVRAFIELRDQQLERVAGRWWARSRWRRCSSATCSACSRRGSSGCSPTRRSRTSATRCWRCWSRDRRRSQAAAFYMTAYLVTVIAAFGVIAVLEPETGGAPTIEAYRGLLWRRPVLGTILMAAMLSLAGIPLTAGFVAKFLLLVAGVEAELWIPVFALVLGSAIGVFYYLRVVVALFSRTEAEEALAHGAHGGAHALRESSPASPLPPSTPVPFGAGLSSSSSPCS